MKEAEIKRSVYRTLVHLYGGPEGQSSVSSLNRCSQSSGSSLNRSSQSSGSSLNRSSRSVLVAECFICPFNFNHKALVYDAIYLLHKLQ